MIQNILNSTKYSLPKLKFPIEKGISPFISAQQLKYHLNHHQNYVDKLNSLIIGTKFEGMELEDVIVGSYKKKIKIFRNAAQHFNHTFYWESLMPNPDGKKREPSEKVMGFIKENWGSFETFKEEFNQKSIDLFGSGWCWLSVKGKIETYSNAGNPIVKRDHPLLCLDVWEHSYYVDYQFKRANYVKSMWNVIDWEFVEDQYEEYLIDYEKKNLGGDGFDDMTG